MVNLIIEISRYLIVLLISIYTWYNFRCFAVQGEEERNHACGRQQIAMFMLHFLAFLVIVLKTGSEMIFLFYVAQVIFLLSYIYLSRLFYRNISRLLINNTCILLVTGMIILTRINPERAVRQFLIIAASVLITMIIPFIMDRVWQLVEIPWIYGIGGLVLLLIVCLLGNTSYGAQLSITIGPVSIQPSEFVKIIFVFFVAAMLYRSTEFENIVATTVVAALHVLVLALSKDLGSALIFFVTYLMMLYVATSRLLYLGTGTALGVAASVAAYHMFPHVRRRFEAFLDPFADVTDRGYQAAHALFAIGTGGWFGMGLYQGMPQKIPVVEKDFIFAAVSEELGAIYSLCLIFICVGCFMQFMLIASRMQAMFYKLIAFGLGTMYITQVFLSIGGTLKFIPSTGVTLPFVSYGGSSILATFLAFQIVQGLYVLKRNEEEEDEER